jgi:ribA/ribD-fused uncharacterized protein
MYVKAKLFKDPLHTQRILNAKTPATMKRNGRLVENFDPKLWDDYKKIVMYIAIREKVKQNETIKKKLLKTAPKTLVEASPWDTVWGVGLAKDDPLIQDRQNWRGQNLLGHLLTSLREDIVNGTSFVTNEDEEKIKELIIN